MNADERRLNESVSAETVVICIIAPEAAAGRRALAAGRVGVGGKGRNEVAEWE